MSDSHDKRAAEIVKKIKYITIASVSEGGEPWNSPVYSAYDDRLNFYWFSDKNSQHSQNVRATKKVFLVIYDSTVPEGTGEGVYIQAEVEELNEEVQVLNALKILDTRVGKTKKRNFDDYSGAALLRGYKAAPSLLWMNDDDEDEHGSYIRDIRVEISIEKVLKYLTS
jgi:uncharacterized protein YhbP (UPF0306 family)